MHVNIHELKNAKNEVVSTNGTLRKPQENPLMMIFLVVLGSFVLGSLPIIYGFTMTSSSTPVTTVPHEGVLWNSVDN
ncbi:hypothetical protein [Crocosphaera chwakensis]|uniref:Uncharacterized protein n=1 Tax=Crocosphaera chwakensis CCY0110 TaxID=391612 RepID=A3ILD8_9CHRO|nr:hypothetical protein [Crocosphaera chwakensis]EAZ92589.1 hypothetical protein CY0110_23521 [Crocosphaera chwakensis CCY0110]